MRPNSGWRRSLAANHSLTLSPRTKQRLAGLVDVADADGIIAVSQRKLKLCMGYSDNGSLDDATRRDLATLELAGYLVCDSPAVASGPGRRSAVAHYRLTTPIRGRTSDNGSNGPSDRRSNVVSIRPARPRQTDAVALLIERISSALVEFSDAA
jgi:hypothetical protein